MYPSSKLLTPEVAFKVFGETTLNWRNKSFFASLGYELNLDDGKITGEGEDVIQFSVNRNNWHLYYGSRNNPLNVDLNYFSTTGHAEAFFMANGSTRNLSNAFESMQFGLDGSFRATTGSFRNPFTRYDRVRAGGRLSFDLEGGFGKNLTYCTNHNPEEFFSYLSAGVSIRGWVDYYESCRSYFFFFDEDDCNEWHERLGAGFSASTKLYSPSPTGASGRINFSLLGWNFGPSFRAGSRCR